MIYINGKTLENISELSSKAQSVLTMIQNGTQWIYEHTNSTYKPPVTAANEDDLLQQIQLGLHAEPYIRFNTFRLSISKLLSMSDSDIQQLVSIDRTGTDNEQDFAALLQRNNLLSYADIDTAISSLQLGNLG